MTGENGYPETPEWRPEPRLCPPGLLNLSREELRKLVEPTPETLAWEMEQQERERPTIVIQPNCVLGDN